MALPVLPSQFEAVKIEPSDNLAVRLWKNLKFWLLICRLLTFILDADGNFTEEFQQMLCDIDCPDEE